MTTGQPKDSGALDKAEAGAGARARARGRAGAGAGRQGGKGGGKGAREAREASGGARTRKGKGKDKGNGQRATARARARRVTRVKSKEKPTRVQVVLEVKKQSPDKDVQCFYCGKNGHQTRDRRNRMREHENGKEALEEKAELPGCEAYAEEDHSWILMFELDSLRERSE